MKQRGFPPQCPQRCSQKWAEREAKLKINVSASCHVKYIYRDFSTNPLCRKAGDAWRQVGHGTQIVPNQQGKMDLEQAGISL